MFEKFKEKRRSKKLVKQNKKEQEYIDSGLKEFENDLIDEDVEKEISDTQYKQGLKDAKIDFYNLAVEVVKEYNLKSYKEIIQNIFPSTVFHEIEYSLNKNCEKFINENNIETFINKLKPEEIIELRNHILNEIKREKDYLNGISVTENKPTKK